MTNPLNALRELSAELRREAERHAAEREYGYEHICNAHADRIDAIVRESEAQGDVGAVEALADLDLIWHSVSDDAETNAAYRRLRSRLTANAQQPAAAEVVATNSAVAAIQFAMKDPEGMTFLRLWNEGEFDTLRREWPDAPVEIYIDADPLAAQPGGSDNDR